jgi:EAL domain-containing protein (putative c-di-GMP-specific phosphodiesterase class I)
MALTREIDHDRVRRAIVSCIGRFCEEQQVTVVAEGTETRAECLALQEMG